MRRTECGRGVRLGSVLVVEGYCANLHTAKGERELRVGKNWMKVGRSAKASFGKPVRPRRRPICRVRVRVSYRKSARGRWCINRGALGAMTSLKDGPEIHLVFSLIDNTKCSIGICHLDLAVN